MLPCLDEGLTVERCVKRGLFALDELGCAGEVIVVDNGSTDDTAFLAARAGARVVSEPERGYGRALRAGFAAASGDYIVMADGDLTYDLAELPRFVAALDDGAAIALGDRMDGILPGAMPWLHRHVGNPLLTAALNLRYGTRVRDAHCGMRAFRRDALPVLALRTDGMELASEMLISAARAGLAVTEVSIAYHPREGESKLVRLRDGWRHLRLLLAP